MHHHLGSFRIDLGRLQFPLTFHSPTGCLPANDLVPIISRDGNIALPIYSPSPAQPFDLGLQTDPTELCHTTGWHPLSIKEICVGLRGKTGTLHLVERYFSGIQILSVPY